jgi:hypothetical protein
MGEEQNNPVPFRPVDLLFRGRREAIHTQNCVSCSGPAEKFEDEISAKEYRISGLCQKCQNEVFGRQYKEPQ